MVVICAVTPVFAQTELSLKQYFEGKHVTLIIDMPASKDGVNVYPERAQALDYSEYANRLKKYGTSVRRGEEIMITKIKAKDKHIEFQLGGGGYGTVGDETDSSAYVPSASKTNREKSVEGELKRENDAARRKRRKNLTTYGAGVSVKTSATGQSLPMLRRLVALVSSERRSREVRVLTSTLAGWIRIPYLLRF